MFDIEYIVQVEWQCTECEFSTASHQEADRHEFESHHALDLYEHSEPA